MLWGLSRNHCLQNMKWQKANQQNDTVKWFRLRSQKLHFQSPFCCQCPDTQGKRSHDRKPIFILVLVTPVILIMHSNLTKINILKPTSSKLFVVGSRILVERAWVLHNANNAPDNSPSYHSWITPRPREGPFSVQESRGRIKSICFEEWGTKSFVTVLLLEFRSRGGRSPSNQHLNSS